MQLDIFNLECFLTVVETGSFTRAAQKLNRTQSAISQQITKLEAAAGQKLITRSKPFSLTTQGSEFYPYAKKIYTLQRDTIHRFTNPDLKGDVRLGIPEDFANIYLQEVLIEFTRIHPNISMHIECGLTLNLYEQFKNDEFDLALVKMHCPDDLPNGVDVWTEQLVWVGDTHYLADSPSIIPLVLSPKPCVYRDAAMQCLEQAGITWDIVFSSHSHASKIAAVKANLGLTVLPKNIVPADMTSYVSTDELPPLNDMQVSLLKKQENNPAVNSFEKFILSKLR